MFDSNSPPIGSSRLLLLLVIAIILVMGITVALNGGTSSVDVDNVTDDIVEENQSVSSFNSMMLGNNSYGTVTKLSSFGNTSSDVKIAFILGVDQQEHRANSIISTMKNEKDLKYAYDIYVINTTNTNSNGSNNNNQNNITVNDMSEALASEFVVPDVINNNYNFTVDIHSTNDSNSYVYVPVDYTYTSKKVVENISENTNVGIYTPDNHAFTEYVSEPIINHDIPSIVYVTTTYFNNGTSPEVSSIINTLDDFDFLHLFDSDTTSDNNTNQSDDIASTNNDSNSSNASSQSSNRMVSNKEVSTN